MRLCELWLLAFGPFTDERLDFSGDEGVVQVVYGPNEAGKSTALRAIGDLFYGIPDRTPDAHLHDMPKLRVGGRIVGAGGEVLEVVRRKGRKQTLLDPGGQAIDEAALARALGGVSRALFDTMFGLDVAGLRAGGERLLRGEGDVGESLFDAGGARGIGEVLRSLRTEAEDLYTPRSRTRRVDELLRQLKEAREELTRKQRSPQAWTDQKKSCEEARSERDRLVAERRTLGAERERLDRALRVLQPLNKLAKIEGDIAAEGSPQPIAALDAAAVAAIEEGLGRARSADIDMPKRAGALEARRADVRAVLRRLGRDLPAERAGELLLDHAAEARLDRLMKSFAGVQAKLDAVVDQLGQKRARLDELERTLERQARPRDRERLRAAVSRAERAGDLDDVVRRLGGRSDALAARVAREAGALGISAHGAGEVPPAPTVEAFVTRAAERAGERRRIDAERRERERSLCEVSAVLEELARQGDVPDEESLAGARARRDALWQRTADDPQTRAAFEAAVAEADALADRLWREADRVAERRRLRAERAGHERAVADLAAAATALTAADDVEREEWRTLWRAVAIEPGEPAAMRGWLERHAELTASVEELAAMRAELVAETTRREAIRAAVAAELEEPVAGVELGPLLDVAGAVLERADREARARQALEDARSAHVADRAALEAEKSQRLEALERWRADWAGAVAPLGLGGDAGIDEAGAVLALLRELADKLRGADDIQRRIEGMERDARELAVFVREIARTHAADLLEAPPVDAANELLGRHRAARAAAERLAELGRQRREIIDVLLGEGSSIEELEQLVRDLDVDEARARRERIREDEERLDEEIERASQDLGRRESSLLLQDPSQGAFGAAADVQAAVAALRRAAERWARLRLATVILGAEVERYRKQNQGPIVARASELFRKLTLGGFREVFVDYDAKDEPQLRGLRDNGRDVDVAGLSDATRDQLYLALRLASLERHAQRSEPLPLVLDDVLERFDDERARAGLEVLCDVAKATQVLLFTHHGRIVDLAGAFGDRVRLHRLGQWKVPTATSSVTTFRLIEPPTK